MQTIEQQLLQKAMDLKEAGNLKQASEIYEQLLTQKWNDPHIPNGLGYIKLVQGDYVRAEELFNDASKLNPRFTDGYQKLGMTLQNQETFLEAIDQFEAAIKKDNKKARSYMNLASALLNVPVTPTFLRPRPTQAPAYNLRHFRR